MTTFAQQSADANRNRVAIIEETTYGTTPSSPAFDLVRYTGESLGMDTDSTESQEIRSDRAIADIIRTGVSASGGIDFELSWGDESSTIGQLFKAGYLSAGFSSEAANSGTTISFAAPSSGIQVVTDSGNGFGSFNAGQWVRMTAAVSPLNNGLFKCVAAAAGAISIVNPNGISAVAGIATVVCTQVKQVVPGTSFTSFTIEKHAQDVTSKEYERLLGMAVANHRLSIPNNGIVTGSFSFLGARSEIADAAIGSSTYTAATTTPVLNGIDNIVAIYIKIGSAWSVQPATQFDYSVENNLRTRLQIGTLGAVSLGLGTVDVTGNLRAYFTDGNLMDEYANFNEVGMAGVFRDSAGNYYAVDFPAVKFTNGRRVAGGINTDMVSDMAFRAKLSATEGVMARFAIDAA